MNDSTIWEQLDNRTHNRARFATKAILRIKTGGYYEGRTENLCFQGAFVRMDVIAGLEPGAEGFLGIFLSEGDGALITEFPCRVTHIETDGVGIHFFDEHFPSGSYVYVKRSNGKLEDGWQILPYGDLIPESVERLLKERENKGPCIICVHEHEDGNKYKVYTVQELMEIQQAVGV